MGLLSKVFGVLLAGIIALAGDVGAQARQDVTAGSGAGMACAHSRMSAHKDSTASSRSICTSLVSSSGML